MAKKSESFNNLIDFCVGIESNPELQGKTEMIFRTILSDYFFKTESAENKKMEAFFNEVELPSFLKNCSSIFEIDVEKLKNEIEDGMINETLCGRIFLSQSYLKTFHSNHPPSYSKLPENLKFELMDEIKAKNSLIIFAFEKLRNDLEADKNRKISTLIALIIKNIHLKTGKPLNKISKPVNEIISSLFIHGNEIFIANQKQLSDIKDNSKIKELIKIFFPVRQFKEISEITEIYNKELERFILRAKRSFR